MKDIYRHKLSELSIMLQLWLLLYQKLRNIKLTLETISQLKQDICLYLIHYQIILGFTLYHPIPSINSLPNEKKMDLSKLKAFADNKINVTQKLKFALVRVENIAY